MYAFTVDGMWVSVGLYACADVYEASGLTTLVEWILSSTCVPAPFIIQEWLVRNSFSWLWVLVALFGPAFYLYWCSSVKSRGGQSALCMPCVRPLYAYS